MDTERKLGKLAEVSRTRERHRQMARTATMKERELVRDLIANHDDVSIAEIGRITGRSRQTIYNWTTRHPDQDVRGD